MDKNSIYLDHAATTPTDRRVVEKMLPYFSAIYANPSSICQAGIEAHCAVNRARRAIADFLSCESEEIIFTAGGTESDNLAILGVAGNFKFKTLKLNSKFDTRKTKCLGADARPHIITSVVEHSAVLGSCRQLEKEGFAVTYLPVLKNGVISVDSLKRALRPQTVLVTIMYANNEIGTIQPIKEISDAIKNFRRSKHDLLKSRKNQASEDYNNLKFIAEYPLLHTDACQASEYLEMDVTKLGVDLLTINGSKIYGPKGVGALYVRSGVELDPIIFGGSQENGLRPGTENVPAIVGFGEAIKLINQYDPQKTLVLRDYLISKLLDIKGTKLNGDARKRLPNNANISFAGVEGEAAILYIDREGVCCATGSACLSRSLEPSHVIMALGCGGEVAHSSLRFTLGRSTTKTQIDEAILKIKKTVADLRQISAVR